MTRKKPVITANNLKPLIKQQEWAQPWIELRKPFARNNWLQSVWNVLGSSLYAGAEALPREWVANLRENGIKVPGAGIECKLMGLLISYSDEFGCVAFSDSYICKAAKHHNFTTVKSRLNTLRSTGRLQKFGEVNNRGGSAFVYKVNALPSTSDRKTCEVVAKYVPEIAIRCAFRESPFIKELGV